MVGVHPGTCENGLLEHAINCDRSEIAVLLRKHGAGLPRYMRDQVHNKIAYYENPRRRNFPNRIRERERWETILLPPPRERLPIALYKYTDLDVLPRDVMQSWPPSGTTQHPPANTMLEDSIHFRVLDLWRAVGSLRRAEAKPEDEALKKTAADLAAKLKEAEQQYADQAKDFDAKKKADDVAQKAKREIEEKHRRATRARLDLDLAKIEVEAAQKQVEYARKAAKK